MKMFCAGQWQDTKQSINVTNPFDQSVIDTVPQGSGEDIQNAVGVLERGARPSNLRRRRPYVTPTCARAGRYTARPCPWAV